MNIVHLSIFEIKHLKEINIYDQIDRLVEEDSWINEYDDATELFEEVEMHHIINLNIDVITMITKKENEHEDNHKTYFLFESGNHNKKLDKLKSYKQNVVQNFKSSKDLVKEQLENCIGIEGYKHKNVVMNQKYVFFQDETEITFLELNKPWKKENIERVNIMTICHGI